MRIRIPSLHKEHAAATTSPPIDSISGEVVAVLHTYIVTRFMSRPTIIMSMIKYFKAIVSDEREIESTGKISGTSWYSNPRPSSDSDSDSLSPFFSVDLFLSLSLSLLHH